jgi:hypothetical protein
MREWVLRPYCRQSPERGVFATRPRQNLICRTIYSLGSLGVEIRLTLAKAIEL